MGVAISWVTSATCECIGFWLAFDFWHSLCKACIVPQSQHQVLPGWKHQSTCSVRWGKVVLGQITPSLLATSDTVFAAYVLSLIDLPTTVSALDNRCSWHQPNL
ncbi:hypothetical protein F4604DRAFT_964819 [Suillus subluteus]|nr:hypothetical protein F4604DRAFT_964819 [Suillus subluteus]